MGILDIVLLVSNTPHIKHANLRVKRFTLPTLHIATHFWRLAFLGQHALNNLNPCQKLLESFKSPLLTF